MATERDPKMHPEDWNWKHKYVYQNKVFCESTHKVTGKKIPWILYQDRVTFQDREEIKDGDTEDYSDDW